MRREKQHAIDATSTTPHKTDGGGATMRKKTLTPIALILMIMLITPSAIGAVTSISTTQKPASPSNATTPITSQPVSPSGSVGNVQQSPPSGCLECNELVDLVVNSAFTYANNKIKLPDGLDLSGSWIDILQELLRGAGQTFKAMRQWIGYFAIGVYLGLSEHEDELPFTISEAVFGSMMVFILEFITGGYGGPVLATTGAMLEVLDYLKKLCDGENYDLGAIMTGMTSMATMTQSSSTENSSSSTGSSSMQSTQSGTFSI
jgi:hypothetical protein